MKIKQWILLISLTIGALIAGALISLLILILNYEKTIVITGDSPVLFTIDAGQSYQTVIHHLQNQGIITKPILLNLLGRLKGSTRQLQSGEYALAPGATVGELLTQFNQGRIAQYGITFVEGWRFSQLFHALATNPYLTHELKSSEEIMTIIPQTLLSPEGYFFPATYFFIKGTSDKILLMKAFALMEEILAKEWAQRDPSVPYTTPYQALIAASLIEKEANLKEEQALIAKVITERLTLNMPLQIDAAVIYGLGTQFKQKLTKAQLLTATPYNTYLHHGLPPTPIALPSKSALHAALHPQGNALYYVAKGDGSHLFSMDLKHHNQAVQCYQLKENWPACEKLNLP